MNTDIKTFLFARWVSTCYADEHLDLNKRHQGDLGFNSAEAMSALNIEDGKWWREQLKHFNDVVYPNYIENGTVENTNKFLNE